MLGNYCEEPTQLETIVDTAHHNNSISELSESEIRDDQDEIRVLLQLCCEILEIDVDDIYDSDYFDHLKKDNEVVESIEENLMYMYMDYREDGKYPKKPDLIRALGNVLNSTERDEISNLHTAAEELGGGDKSEWSRGCIATAKLLNGDH